MKITQSKPYIGTEEYKRIKECFDSDWLTEGPKSEEFVQRCLDIIGSKYAVLAPNGTLALYLGLKSLGIGLGDEVIVPDFTFIASATSICMANATPVFVDVGEDLQIDIGECRRALTNKTKAIMPVHMYGASANMDHITEFAEENNLLIIEDSAQAMGVHWNGRHCGSFGDVGCFSFFADKSLTTIEGGLVCTDKKDVYDKLCFLRNQGRKNRGTFIHPEIGFNFRLNDLQAAIGLVQLEKSEYIFSRRKKIYNIYQKHMEGFDKVRFMPVHEKSNLIPFRVIIFTEDFQQDISDFLKDRGIETRTLFYPLHKQPCFKKYNYSDCDFKNSIKAFEHGLCLPAYPQLSEEEIKYICDSIKEYYNNGI